VLIDGGIPEAAPLVLANIKAAGFDPKDVRWILSSHEHFDHAGALAALQHATGAKVAAMPAAAEVLESGKADPADPQFGGLDAFPAVHVDKRLTDGEKLTLGDITLTARATLAHAAGSTSWTWQSCGDQGKCLTIAYADSASAISAKRYRFTDHPERIAAVRQGYARFAELPCDLLVTPHPGASDLFARLAGTAPLVDPTACRKYAAAATTRFEQRLSEEAAPEAKETRS
jgi:metallo-beta-lactamase class B